MDQNSDSSSRTGCAIMPRLRSAATLSTRRPDADSIRGSFFPRLAARNSSTVLSFALRSISATPSIWSADVMKRKTKKRIPPAMQPMSPATPTQM